MPTPATSEAAASATPPTVDYPKLPPRPFASVSPEEYISERVNGAITWYDKTANVTVVQSEVIR